MGSTLSSTFRPKFHLYIVIVSTFAELATSIVISELTPMHSDTMLLTTHVYKFFSVYRHQILRPANPWPPISYPKLVSALIRLYVRINRGIQLLRRFLISSFRHSVSLVFGIITIFVFVARLIILSELESDLSLFDHTWAATCGSYTTDNLYVCQGKYSVV